VRSRGRRGRPALPGPRAAVRAGGAVRPPARRPRRRLPARPLEFPGAEPGTSYSMTEVGRAAALASVDEDGWSRSSSGARRGGRAPARWRRNCAPPSPGGLGMPRRCCTCCGRRTTCTFDEVAAGRDAGGAMDARCCSATPPSPSL
jgi:hypothetical protein